MTTGNREKTEREYRYWLCNIPRFGARKIAKLLEYFGSAQEVWGSTEDSLKKAMEELSSERKLFGEEDFKILLEAKKNEEDAVKSYHKLREEGIRFITPDDRCYPERLRTLYDMPQGLYLRGELPKEASMRPAAAIVGARNCSHYGEEMAFALALELARRGVQIISGMALGIDGAAHRGALKAGGKTYAVLGSGVDVCYPRTNQDIYRQLTAVPGSGGALSEFAVGTAPFASNFPMRNRIISGLADLVIVVEARFRSGSLITADQALEQGRDVYVVPGRVTDSLSRGCNELINQGAGIITDPVEFAEKHFSNQVSYEPKCKKNKILLALSEEKVYSCLDFSPTHLSIIIDRTGFSMQETVSILMQLMMKGLVKETSKNYYALKFR